MTTTIRETDKFNYFKENMTGHTSIYNNHTGRQSNWNTGSEVEVEKEHISKLSDTKFDEYCEMMTSNE